MIGKIHLDGTVQGFDYREVLPGQGYYYQPRFLPENRSKIYPGYVTDIITEKSIELTHQNLNDCHFSRCFSNNSMTE